MCCSIFGLVAEFVCTSISNSAWCPFCFALDLAVSMEVRSPLGRTRMLPRFFDHHNFISHHEPSVSNVSARCALLPRTIQTTSSGPAASLKPRVCLCARTRFRPHLHPINRSLARPSPDDPLSLRHQCRLRPNVHSKYTLAASEAV